MRIFFALFFLFSFQQLKAQELFVYTEPASNMAAKSIGVRIANSLMHESTGKYSYHLLPEIMLGLSKKIMIHAEGFFSNRDQKFNTEGASLYLKYRFYSMDAVHSHFRVAAFAKAAYNNSHIHQAAIDLAGYNSGYEGGIIATKLINKLALSLSSSFLHATNNGDGNKFQYGNKSKDAVSYTVSAGKLLLPKTYTDYDQTNVNVMVELLGQVNLNSGKSYLDIAPSLQFIFLSKMRLDMGYRFALVKDLSRMADYGFLLRLEYNFFNVYK
ncbi:MAG: hypothetical protein ABI741_13735 [Ferruginibacter sp.]